jgi:hypothetical protein
MTHNGLAWALIAFSHEPGFNERVIDRRGRRLAHL